MHTDKHVSKPKGLIENTVYEYFSRGKHMIQRHKTYPPVTLEDARIRALGRSEFTTDTIKMTCN